MLIPVEEQNVELYLEKVEDITNETFLEFITDIYREYKPVIKCLLNNLDDIRPDYFIGSKADLAVSGLDYDAIKPVLRKSKETTIQDYIELVNRFLKELQSSISHNFNRDKEYLNQLSDLYSKIHSVKPDNVNTRLMKSYEEIRDKSNVNGDFILPEVVESLRILYITGNLSSLRDSHHPS